MKKTIAIGILALFLAVPFGSQAATRDELQTQYVSALQQVIVLLQQQVTLLEALLAKQSTPMTATADNSGNTQQSQAVATPTPVTFEVWQLTFEPSLNDIYVLATDDIELGSIQLTDATGAAVQNSFTLGSRRQFSESEQCINLSSGEKKCGGTMNRLNSASPLDAGTYAITLRGANGGTYSGQVTVTSAE